MATCAHAKAGQARFRRVPLSQCIHSGCNFMHHRCAEHMERSRVLPSSKRSWFTSIMPPEAASAPRAAAKLTPLRMCRSWSCHWTLLVPRYTGSAGSKCHRSTVRPRHLADRDSWFFMHAPRNRIQPCPSAGLRCVAARVRARPAVIGPRASASGSTRVGELCAARRAESLTVGSLSTLSGMLVRYRWARLRLATSGRGSHGG